MADRTRDEHLDWAKKRAREYMAMNDYGEAVTSMLSDLSKHPDWQDGALLGTMMMLWAVDQSPANAERIIEGFR